MAGSSGQGLGDSNDKTKFPRFGLVGAFIVRYVCVFEVRGSLVRTGELSTADRPTKVAKFRCTGLFSLSKPVTPPRKPTH